VDLARMKCSLVVAATGRHHGTGREAKGTGPNPGMLVPVIGRLDSQRTPDATGRLGWTLAGVGCAGALGAALLSPENARSAAAQDWPPFVLVAGLLLVGLVADEDRLFSAAGHALARLAPNGFVLYLGAVGLIVSVSTVLNLDTSVAFLTPILVYTARNRGEGEAPLLYGCLLLSNAGSLLLPGSNLTNLIVLGHLHLSGGQFLRHMAPAAIAAALVTALVVGVAEHRSLRATVASASERERPVLGVGLIAVVAVTVLVLVLRSPAAPVAAVGVVAVAARSLSSAVSPRRALGVLGLPVLVGLFGVADALGTLGRAWSGPETLLSHLNSWGTAVVGALFSVLANNLPAASLLAARVPPRPFSLLVGLNIGPNLFVTGSLAWLLWLRSAQAAGAHPSIAKATRLGLVVVPLSMAAAVGMLTLAGSR
jgi:arsenical pump membrane protein